MASTGACRFSIWASSQLREMTACARSNSGDEVALISDEMTLSRYDSTSIRFTTRTPSLEGVRINAPRKRWSSRRSQWKCTPMVTPRRSNESEGSVGSKCSVSNV